MSYFEINHSIFGFTPYIVIGWSVNEDKVSSHIKKKYYGKKIWEDCKKFKKLYKTRLNENE